MARNINEIQSEMIANVQADPVLSGLSSTSRRAIWRLWTYVFAVCVNIMEQLQDIFKAQTEATVALSAPNTPQWVQDKVFKFQYDATNPQVVQLINLVPQYPVVNESLRIVTRCSVKTTIANSVLIKVAKGSTPAALSSPELSALQSYVNIVGVAGVKYVVSSGSSDKLYIQANIYYQGAYSSVISASVIAAVEAYLAAVPFDGVVKMSDLELAIKAVPGVNDVLFQNVKARANGTPLGSATYLVSGQQYIGRYWNTVAGYIVGETTGGSTLADTLTFIPE